jgi:hypothetical protein
MQTDSYINYIRGRATEAKHAKHTLELFEKAKPIVDWLENGTAIDDELIKEFIATYRMIDLEEIN